jgi:pimeloyl-ACP methyl ester carboxylesterase
VMNDCTSTGMSVPETDQAQAQTVDGFALSTVQLIRALELDQPDILGTSLGGYVALTIAVDYGDMVNHVVLADTSSGGLLGKL